MSTVFFIGDLHLGHKNITQFGQRDFETIEDHNEAIVQAWNTVVTKHDLVWVLGDICMKVEDMQLFDRMKGMKRLILGNHDQFDIGVYAKYFNKVYAFQKKYGLVMTHIPIHPDELVYRTWKWNVHGHIHDPAKQPQDKRYINVNIDYVGYLHPTPLDHILTEVKLRENYQQIGMEE